MNIERWLLPEGSEDLLPPLAARVETVRRHLLDLFELWGYKYVIPPMFEYLESLLTGSGEELDLLTFKALDLLSGRTVGFRADITPQVARIDAHSLGKPGVQRLCYVGTAVRTEAASIFSGRNPISAGAELYGDASERADAEIVSLMIESLMALGLNSIHLNLGHVGIFRETIDRLNLQKAERDLIFTAVQKKAILDLEEICHKCGLSKSDTHIIKELPNFCGNSEVLARARVLFKSYTGILKRIGNLEKLHSIVLERYPDIQIYFDLSELRGFSYHTGIVFSANLDGSSQTLAQGGRYDYVGEVFGRNAREATGFSLDVVNLAKESIEQKAKKESVLVIGRDQDSHRKLWKKIEELRGEGFIVSESGTVGEHDWVLDYRKGEWQMARSGKTDE
ncbi:MAG: ATP phosphoribosyltransferase regulatory subunit [Pseudomonadota bacterium]|nr:ATP phosphoribosyltransferase regulatory subunit [Pseudomonadota bacterium]